MIYSNLLSKEERCKLMLDTLIQEDELIQECMMANSSLNLWLGKQDTPYKYKGAFKQVIRCTGPAYDPHVTERMRILAAAEEKLKSFQANFY